MLAVLCSFLSIAGSPAPVETGTCGSYLYQPAFCIDYECRLPAEPYLPQPGDIMLPPGSFGVLARHALDGGGIRSQRLRHRVRPSRRHPGHSGGRSSGYLVGPHPGRRTALEGVRRHRSRVDSPPLRAVDAGTIVPLDRVRPGPGRQTFRVSSAVPANDALPHARSDPHLLRRQAARRQPLQLLLLRTRHGSLRRGGTARCGADAAVGHLSARSLLRTLLQSLHRPPSGHQRRLVSAGSAGSINPDERRAGSRKRPSACKHDC